MKPANKLTKGLYLSFSKSKWITSRAVFPKQLPLLFKTKEAVVVVPLRRQLEMKKLVNMPKTVSNTISKDSVLDRTSQKIPE